MTQIIRRNDVVAKLAIAYEKDIGSVVISINQVISDAKSLPVDMPVTILGHNETAKLEVLNRIKNQGWKVELLGDTIRLS